ncbi:MAG: hypothetical protein IAG13_33030 [Deltaproteobacteria bacterium]|nr:hypothetical protein [Nannocystaceae bacterium]
MVWLGERRGDLVDWVTQRWVQITGRRIALADAPWLAGPAGSVRGIGADFFARWGESQGMRVLPPGHDDGLVDGLSALAGPSFDPQRVHPSIDDFYAHTAAFDLSIESRWSGPFRAFGWLIARLFARRLAQLNMPLSSRELRGGFESRIVRLGDAHGHVRHTAWVRTAVETGRPAFVGEYGTTIIPGHAGPCIKVVFPLPNGNAIIVLRPRVDPNGGLSLVSDGRRFGDPGFYFTVLAEPGEVWARYVRTMKEGLSLRVEGGAMTASHRFAVFGLTFLELRYAIARKTERREGSPSRVRT